MPKGRKTTAKQSAKQTCARWNAGDDAKLLHLFKTGAVDLKDLSCTAVKEVIEHYFPDRPYASFKNLYCKKLRAYNVDKVKQGQRKGKFDC